MTRLYSPTCTRVIPLSMPLPTSPTVPPSVSSVSLREAVHHGGLSGRSPQGRVLEFAGCSTVFRSIPPSLRRRQTPKAFPQCLCGEAVHHGGLLGRSPQSRVHRQPRNPRCSSLRKLSILNLDEFSPYSVPVRYFFFHNPKL